MNKNKTIDEKIKQYESLMHRVLQDFNVKVDYEDLLQEMRIVVWKALADENPRTMYIEGTTKFSTYLYNNMKNRWINIFKVEYKIDIEAKRTINSKAKKNMARPKLIGDLSFQQQINSLASSYAADSIRLQSDIAMFCSTLSTFERLLWDLNLEGWKQEEVVKRLKEQNIIKNQSTVSRHLTSINDKFIAFMKTGEL
jgi:RNA polymerase sigma factor (sigma-70 family)